MCRLSTPGCCIKIWLSSIRSTLFLSFSWPWYSITHRNINKLHIKFNRCHLTHLQFMARKQHCDNFKNNSQVLRHSLLVTKQTSQLLWIRSRLQVRHITSFLGRSILLMNWTGYVFGVLKHKLPLLSLIFRGFIFLTHIDQTQNYTPFRCLS